MPPLDQEDLDHENELAVQNSFQSEVDRVVLLVYNEVVVVLVEDTNEMENPAPQMMMIL